MRKIIIFLSFVLLLSATAVWAQKWGLDTAGETSGLKDTAIAKTGSIPSAVGIVLGQAVLYLGIIFFLLIVYAGFLWMTAGGNDKKVEEGKQILIAAVTGLVIVISAYAITRFIFGEVLSVSAKKCTTTEQKAKFAACQDKNTQACIFEGIKGNYEPGLCDGGINIQCCIVR